MRFIAECRLNNQKIDIEFFGRDNKYYKLIGNFLNDEEIYLIYLFDITELKNKQNQLEIAANFDELTHLPNKNKLIKDMLELIYNKTIIILTDIKSMRQINSLYGYDIGDKFLVEFSKLLKSELSENFRFYRLYGNVFVIYDSIGVNCNLSNDFYYDIFKKLNEKTVKIDKLDIPVDIRMGIATCEDLELKDENYPFAQLKIAEIALLEAKKNNLDILLYSQINDIEKRYKENRFWMLTFKNLPKNKHCKIIPFFQPIINNHSQAIDKYEALMRISVNDKIYSPDKFMNIATDTGEIKELTKIMINEVLKVIKDKNIQVAINLTPQDIKADIASFLTKKLDEYHIDANTITLELVESEDFYLLESEINKLKEIGFKISLDDFGSGFSNFSKLISIQIDYIKIDGSIIKNIHTDFNNMQIVKNIHEIAKTLGCKTIAEYVSSAKIFSKVVDLGIDFSQGYFFYKPSPEIL
jgi:diguanylate cyclase (GGDEF)-like protein